MGGWMAAGSRSPPSGCWGWVQRARVLREGGLAAEPTQLIGLRAVTGRQLPPRERCLCGCEQCAQSAFALAGECRSAGRSLAEVLGQPRWPCPVLGGPAGPWHGHRGT